MARAQVDNEARPRIQAYTLPYPSVMLPLSCARVKF